MIYNMERPMNFDQVIGQELVVENIRNQSKAGAFFPVLILCGQYGSGKTTIARLIAMAANCEHKDGNGNPCGKCDSCRAVLEHSQEGVIEIDGATNNGVDHIRKLMNQVVTLGVFPKKVVIIDEAHMMSRAAFNAMLIPLENPPEHCIFIICTTEADALPHTITSRMPVYTFGKIPDGLIKDHVLKVARRNQIRISQDAAGLISRYADGAMRNALQILEQMSKQKAGNGMIEAEDVVCVLGLSSMEQQAAFLKGCLGRDTKNIIQVLRGCEKEGVSLRTFIQDVLRMNTDLLLVRAGAEVVGTEFYLSCLEELSGCTDTDLVHVNKMLGKIISVRTGQMSVERIVAEVIADVFPDSPPRQENPGCRNRGCASSIEEKEAAQEPETADIHTEKTLVKEAEAKEAPPRPFQEREEETDGETTEGGFTGGFFGGGLFGDLFGEMDLMEEGAGSSEKENTEEKEKEAEGTPDRKVEMKDSMPPHGEKRLLWSDMAERGILPSEVKIPIPEKEEEINAACEAEREAYEEKEDTLENGSTGIDLAEARESLSGLLKNPGFKMLYNKARVEEKDFHIYLYFNKTALAEAARMFLTDVSGIIAATDGE